MPGKAFRERNTNCEQWLSFMGGFNGDFHFEQYSELELLEFLLYLFIFKKNNQEHQSVVKWQNYCGD